MSFLRGTDHSQKWKETKWPSDSFLPRDEQNRLAEKRAENKDILLNKRNSKQERKYPGGKQPNQNEKFYNSDIVREQVLQKFDKDHHEILKQVESNKIGMDTASDKIR